MTRRADWKYGQPKKKFLSDCARMLSTSAGKAMFAVYPQTMADTIAEAVAEYRPVKKPTTLEAAFVEDVRNYLAKTQDDAKQRVELIVRRAKKLTMEDICEAA